jgi:hypothetical protein
LRLKKKCFDHIFGTAAFAPFVELLKEEFDDSVFDVIIGNFLQAV